MSLSPQQWNDLCDAIRKNECVLLLGPNAATYEGKYLQDHLAQKFADILQQEYKFKAKQCNRPLFELVKLFGEVCPKSRFSTKIKNLISEFYEQLASKQISTYNLIANLPFRYIINTNADDVLEKALKAQKIPVNSHFYHFSNPPHNAEVNKAVDSSFEDQGNWCLLYNLIGHYSEPSSLVLTEEDRLEFIEKILQNDKESIPNNIAFHLVTRGEVKMPKTYLFIGFDFNEWYLRLIIHLLRDKKAQTLPPTFTLQDPKSLRPDALFFYDKSFEMVFVNHSPDTFLQELGKQLGIAPLPKVTEPLKLFLLYAMEDEPLRKELETHLKVIERTGLVDLWHEGKMLAGDNMDETIAKNLETAHIIIPLITANFIASDKLYQNYLQKAMERHHSNKARLVPILMQHCYLGETVFDGWKIMQPKRGKPVYSNEHDTNQVLTEVVAALSDIIKTFKTTLIS